MFQRNLPVTVLYADTPPAAENSATSPVTLASVPANRVPCGRMIRTAPVPRVIRCRALTAVEPGAVCVMYRYGPSTRQLCPAPPVDRCHSTRPVESEYAVTVCEATITTL